MSILSARSSERFSISKHSLLQSDEFPLVEILDAQRIAAVFQEEQIEFGQADFDRSRSADDASSSSMALRSMQRRLGDRERIVTWLRPTRPEWMSQKDYQKVPASVEIRLVDIQVNRPGSRSAGFTLATTMLDRERHGADWSGSLVVRRVSERANRWPWPPWFHVPSRSLATGPTAPSHVKINDDRKF